MVIGKLIIIWISGNTHLDQEIDHIIDNRKDTVIRKLIKISMSENTRGDQELDDNVDERVYTW